MQYQHTSNLHITKLAYLDLGPWYLHTLAAQYNKLKQTLWWSWCSTRKQSKINNIVCRPVHHDCYINTAQSYIYASFTADYIVYNLCCDLKQAYRYLTMYLPTLTRQFWTRKSSTRMCWVAVGLVIFCWLFLLSWSTKHPVCPPLENTTRQKCRPATTKGWVLTLIICGSPSNIIPSHIVLPHLKWDSTELPCPPSITEAQNFHVHPQ